MEKKDGPNRSLTSSNRWSYVPGKKFTLTPLNLDDIRKELLKHSQEKHSQESEDVESDDTEDAGESDGTVDDEESEAARNVVECDEIYDDPNKITLSNNQLKKQCTSLVDFQRKLTNTSSEIPEHAKEQTRKETDQEIKHCFNSSHKHSSFSSSLETVFEDTIKLEKHGDLYKECENKENISSYVEPLNLSKERRKIENSFELDLSALSLHTPVKKKENVFNYATPRINIIPPSESKSVNKTGPLFKTPNVSKNPYALKKLFKTPVNKPLMAPQLSSIRKQGTPYQSVKKTYSREHTSIHESGENQRVPLIPVMLPNEYELDRILVNNTEYIVMNMIGRGGSSEVFHAFNPEEKVHVAIKSVSLSEPTTAEGYINEVKLLESLQSCDRIIKMYDYEVRDDKLLVVLENGGDDLSTILKQLSTKQTYLPTYMLIFYWMEMLYAVNQIHSNGVIHSDLKPANFLRAEGGLKLIDFGIASKVQEDMTCVYKSNQEGSCNYISPEALNIQTNGNVNSPSYGKPKYKIHFKSDVWSLGCILYQLVYRRTPFQHLNQIWAKLAAIIDPKHQIQYPPATWVPPRIVNTIKRCLQHDMKSRPSVDELLQEYEQYLKNI